MTDNTGSIEYVNPKFTDVTGYSAEEALGQNPRILKSGYTCRKDYESLWATILAGHIWRGTLQNKAKDGHLFWEDAQIAPVRDHDGDITHFVAIKEDITERVETQERMQAANKALRESEDNLRRVFSTIQDGIFVIKNNLFTLVNESFASMVGLTPDAMIGSDWTEFLHEDDLPDLLKFRKGLKGQLTGHEVRLRQQDGGVRHVELWAALATGFAKGADTIGTVKDLTEKRQADAEKMEFEVRLNHANKMEAIGTLAGGIAHDFNNILGAISGFAHLALQSAPADSPLAEDIGDILQASDRAVGLIRQILNFSRRADVDEQPVNVTEIVEEAIQLLRASIPKTIRLTSYTDSRPKMVLANPSQIHQVILNLCTNAASAIEDNSGDIRVQLNEIEINNEQDIVRAGLPQGSYAKLVVSDTGTGVDDDTLPRLFEPYFTTKAEGQGTGMGLAVVHGIIQSCGGSIHVGKAANGDTAFSVLLPLIEAEQQAAKITPGALPLGQGRILWIDDERAITRIAKRVLGQLGYTVETADSAAAALEILHDRLMEFDLIITDQSMPGMTGMELAVEVLGKRPDLPIILCSGFAGKLSEEDTKEAGIAEFIWKPFIPSELANIVYEVLQKQENQKT
jgi:PAS domain S-box-containing protein